MPAPPVPTLRDHAAFSRAYGLHARSVHAAAMAVLGDPARAQDVVQDVFLRLWRRPEAFDSRRGALGPYLRVMARSRALDVWRETQAAHRLDDRLRAVAGVVDEPPPGADGLPLERRAVRDAVRTLPAEQREAVVLAYWADLTAAEIARRTNVPLGTAKSRVRLGVIRLRQSCGPEAEGEAEAEAAAA